MQRLLTALVALPVLIASVCVAWLEPLFVWIACVALALGLYEFYVLAKRTGAEADRATGMVFAVGVLTVFYLGALELLPTLLVALVIATLVRALVRGAPFDRMLASAGATAFGVLYVALLGGYLIRVRTGFDDPTAARLLIFYFLVLMGSDSAAYYTGRLMGRRKLAPSISPGKTWEGAVGGMTASLIAAGIAGFFLLPQVPLAALLGLAVVMNVFGVLGDLAESALKRGAGAKDAASILPGHGGLLDRLDSLLFNAPLIYYFGQIFFGVSSKQ